MRRNGKNKPGIREYLAPLLETATKEEIALARKQYWKEYRIRHRRNARKKLKMLEIGFTQAEWKRICKAAHEHKRGRSRFIKQACLAYLEQRFLVPDIVAVHEIKGLLSMHLTFIKDKIDEKLLPEAIGKYLLVHMAELADALLTKLETPKQIIGDH